MQLQTLKNILEALLLSADKPMDVRRIEALFEADEDRPSKDEIRQALEALREDYQDRGVQLKEVASGYRMQVAEDNAPWVARLWEEKPPRYSRALLETLVLIAYRQPITRGEIEDIRGVSVSSHIIKTLLEREWVRVLGHKDVPGKPAMYGTTREFLDYFNLKSLDELPALSDIKDLDKLHPELALDDSDKADDAGDGDRETGNEPHQPVEVDTADTPSEAAEQADDSLADQPTDATAETDESAPTQGLDDEDEARPEGVSEEDTGTDRELQTG
jgi:segregation and condensation protein B